MQIRLVVASDGSEQGPEDEELTQALHDWLTEDRGVGLHAEISRSGGEPGRGSGAMSGDPSGWIQLLVGSGFSAAGLSTRTWPSVPRCPVAGRTRPWSSSGTAPGSR